MKKTIKRRKKLTLDDLLALYKRKVRDFISHNGIMLKVEIEITPEFYRICENRIIEGHKKYGNDWTKKDCLKELEYEKYDIFNYLILDACQKEWLMS